MIRRIEQIILVFGAVGLLLAVVLSLSSTTSWSLVALGGGGGTGSAGGTGGTGGTGAAGGTGGTGAPGTVTPSPTPTPSFVSSSHADCSGANCSLTLPAGMQDGDILYIHATTNNTSSIVGTAATKTFSYTVGPSSDFNSGRGVALYKRWTAADSGISSITFSGSLNGDEICAAAFRGVNNPDLYSLAWSTPAGSTTPTAAAITTSFTNDLLIYSAGFGGTVSVSAVATGFTNAINEPSGASNYGCDIEYKLQGTAGTTGTVHNTLSGSTNNVAILATFQP